MAGLVVLFGRGYRLPRGAAAAALFGYMTLGLMLLPNRPIIKAACRLRNDQPETR